MRRLGALAVVLAACSASEPGPGVDVDRAMAHVDALAGTIGRRPDGSDGARRAAAYIRGELERMNLVVEQLPLGDVAVPAIDVAGEHVRDASTIHSDDADLLVHFGPPGRALLVMAHYDTVPDSPGAVDNAAAVGVSLELARVLAAHAPAQPVLIAFTADEERGLVGAEALAGRRGDEVELAIALDLIGGSGDLSLNGASRLIGDAELRWLARAADRAGVALRAPLPHRVISRWWPQAERADHGAFTRRGIRAFHLYDRGQDRDWIDLAYHSPADVPSRVDRSSVDEVGRLLRALVADRPPPHAGDGFWLPLATNMVIPRWLLIAIELALAAIALAALVSLAFAGSVLPPERGAGVLAAIACLVVAGGVTYAAERAFSADHPMPWIHDPARAELAEALVLIGMLGIAPRVVARFTSWAGTRRYLALAIAWPLAGGLVLIAIGAPELAWIWLVPAAALAFAPRLRIASPIALVVAMLPLALVLAPRQLREAAWNGFLPSGVPLAAWLVALGASPIAALAWWLRSHAPRSPLGTLVLGVGCALAVTTGAFLMATASPRCNALDFSRLSLACETGPTWP